LRALRKRVIFQRTVIRRSFLLVTIRINVIRAIASIISITAIATITTITTITSIAVVAWTFLDGRGVSYL
jgi:hypothetical protein